MPTMLLRRILATGAAGALCTLLACGGDDDQRAPTPTPTPAVTTGDEFDLDIALALARLSLQAYQALADFQDGSPFTLPPPYVLQEQFFTDERYAGEGLGDGQAVPIAYVATAGSDLFVVFRGTKTISEWIDDADVAQVPFTAISRGGRTEQGFTDVYGTFRDALLARVQALLAAGGVQRVLVTGHSLGAALALLGAADLAQATGQTPILYSFAGPRVGNPIFALRYGELIATSWRVANSHDEVPTLPPVVATKIVNGQLREFFYEHVDAAETITFGEPIRSLADLEFNHSLCNYYDTLCAQTADPAACMALAGGADGCHPPAPPA